MSKNLGIIVLVLIGGYFLLSRNKDVPKEETMPTTTEENKSDIKVTPIEHATMMLEWTGKIIYTDPVGAEHFTDTTPADLVLLTDIHGDHLDAAALGKVVGDKTIVVAPQAVADELGENFTGKVTVLKNGGTANQAGFLIEAVPMYNLPESPGAYHTKGRGNGYVLEALGKRVYISGDTSGISEMRNLKNIDLAFVSMNLPYTMSVEEAADAVLAFKPKRVTPYHYRTPSGLSDINKFRSLVNAGDPSIEVDLMNFYE